MVKMTKMATATVFSMVTLSFQATHATEEKSVEQCTDKYSSITEELYQKIDDRFFACNDHNEECIQEATNEALSETINTIRSIEQTCPDYLNSSDIIELGESVMCITQFHEQAAACPGGADQPNCPATNQFIVCSDKVAENVDKFRQDIIDAGIPLSYRL